MNRTSIRRWVKNPWSIMKTISRWGLLNWLADKPYLTLMFRAHLGKRLNWNEPVTYNEKLQWLKLYDRQPIYSRMVEKYEMKKYVAERVGEQYVHRVVGGPWLRFEDIDFSKLPEKFALKTTHDSGGVLLCTDKRKMDFEEAKSFIQKHLRRNYYLSSREWPYKHVSPRIFAEEYLEGDDLKDYKFFCFDGVPKMLFVASERQRKDTETKFDFFDMDFNHLPILNGHPNSANVIERPATFEAMKELAAKLSVGIPHVRVDFYECAGKLYVGELTFFHWGGMVPFDPPEWDEIMGSWIKLPQEVRRGK